ncbi:MAG: thioredoxin [Bacteroidetes bacterium]|uniref:Thioredoxin n=1 Tax=Candidatus Gallipaludibacter merdavium TaxID=2840839 RepID=A0A9D9HSY5_9BACT|nr:thioredoxin [Candidatus Gallipaludibacter merdavium]
MKKTFFLSIITLLAFTACATDNNKKQTNNVNITDKTTTTMKPIELNKQDFLAKVVNYEANPTEWKYLGDKPAIIDFYASWCGPCKMVAPILEELASEYGDKIYIYKVNTENEQELAAAFGIRSIPTILFVPLNGQPQMVTGAMPKSSFKQAIDNILLK